MVVSESDLVRGFSVLLCGILLILAAAKCAYGLLPVEGEYVHAQGVPCTQNLDTQICTLYVYARRIEYKEGAIGFPFTLL